MAGAAAAISALPRTGAGSKLLWGEWARLGSKQTLVLLARAMRKKKASKRSANTYSDKPNNREVSEHTRRTPETRRPSGPPDTEVAGSVIGSGSLSAKAGAPPSFVTGGKAKVDRGGVLMSSAFAVSQWMRGFAILEDVWRASPFAVFSKVVLQIPVASHRGVAGGPGGLLRWNASYLEINRGGSSHTSPADCTWMSPKISPPHSISIWP